MGYNSSTGLIYSPVSIYDVQRCFGLSSPDLATLILNGNINMWSDIKPIYQIKKTQLSAADRANPRTIAGFKTGAGIKKWASTWADYIDGKDISTGSVVSQVWALDRPVVDGSCAFRLTDFSGYHHFVGRMFNIYSLFGNIDHLLIPSASGENGTNVAFSFGFTYPVADGSIMASQLFGDCLDYYPAVILTNGSTGSNSYQYAKTADNPISAYSNSRVTINVDTAEFASAIASDMNVSNPYSRYPLITGTQWTACVVLLSQALVNIHKVPSSATIVRLEYESGVDRRTLPIKQSKYNNIEWMKMTVTISKVSGYTRRYKIDSIVVTAKMLTTTSVAFVINAQLSTPQGTVNVVNTASGQSINVNGYSNVTFSGTVGEVIKSLGFSETTYDVEATTPGNQLVNGTLTFHNTKGDFSGTFSIDVSGGAGTYTKEDINLL
ncbi:MAG: hypothetical protein IKD75_15525 [Prevotella sp.]|nr:hypothetical protein [Prevotella sp.]MBR4699761.1 hypothetical protein [Prevotella sp.]